jgi:hypothetical protein
MTIICKIYFDLFYRLYEIISDIFYFHKIQDGAEIQLFILFDRNYAVNLRQFCLDIDKVVTRLYFYSIFSIVLMTNIF